MADALIVSCPDCEKKFKPKTDVRGKKIKCPFCTNPIVVPAVKNGKAGKEKPESTTADKAKSNGKKTEDTPPAAPENKPPPAVDDDFDGSPDPYGVKHVDLVPRCPNCTFEMKQHDIICLKCGYNTLTRQWGKTEKVFGNTYSRQIMYMLPALGAGAFGIFAILGLIFFGTVVPYLLDGTWLSFLDGEWSRMWGTIVVLTWIFASGVFCMKKFIERPRAEEIQME